MILAAHYGSLDYLGWKDTRSSKMKIKMFRSCKTGILCLMDEFPSLDRELKQKPVGSPCRVPTPLQSLLLSLLSPQLTLSPRLGR